MDGDGQPEVRLGFGGLPVPPALAQTAGSTVEFEGNVTGETMEVGSEKLMVTAESGAKMIKVVGTGAAAPAAK